MTSTVRGAQGPEWCGEGSDHPSAQWFPMSRTGRRHASYYDPATGEFALLDHLLQHPPPAVRRGPRRHPVVQRQRQTSCRGSTPGSTTRRGDEEAAQGWCPKVARPPTGDGADHAALRTSRRRRRPDPRHPHRRRVLRGHRQPGGPHRVGGRDGAVPGPPRARRPRRQPARDVHRRGLRAAVDREPRRRPGPDRPRPPRHRRPTATGSSGRRCRGAATWPASTAAGAGC